jgi:hypothetical protein
MGDELELLDSYYVAYDHICYTALMGLYSRTKETDTILFAGFDWNNKEHRFLLHIALNFPSTLGEKQIAVDASWFVRRKIMRKTQRKVLFTPHGSTSVINVPEFLELLRPSAQKLFDGESFSFGDIYEVYYEQ